MWFCYNFGCQKEVAPLPAPDKNDDTFDQNQSLAILERLYDGKPVAPYLFYPIIDALEKRLSSGTATFSQKLIYLLLQIKIQNNTRLLALVANINVKFMQFMHTDYTFTKDIFPIFSPTFSYALKNFFISSMESQLSQNKEYAENGIFIKLSALSALAMIGGTGSTFYKGNWVDTVIEDVYDSPQNYSLAALEAMFRTRPECVTSLRILPFANNINDTDADARATAIEVLQYMLQARTEPFSNATLIAIFSKLDDIEEKVRRAAVEMVGAIAQARPNLLTTNRLNAVIKITSDHDILAAIAAFKTLERIFQARPDLISHKLMNKFIPLFSHKDLGANARNLFKCMLEARPDLANQRIVSVNQQLNVDDRYVRCEALICLQTTFQTQPNLVSNEMLVNIFQQLKHNDTLVQYFALETLKPMFRARPDLATASIIDDIIRTLSSDHYMVVAEAFNALGVVCKTQPDLLTSKKMDLIAQMLVKYEDISLIVVPALDGLKAIFQAKPEFAKNEGINDSIVKILHEGMPPYCHAGLQLCTNIFDANQDFSPKNTPVSLEEKVLQFYIQAMKELRPAPTETSQAKVNLKVS